MVPPRRFVGASGTTTNEHRRDRHQPRRNSWLDGQDAGSVACTVDVQKDTVKAPSSSRGSRPVTRPPSSSSRNAASAPSTSDCSVYAIEIGKRDSVVAA